MNAQCKCLLIRVYGIVQGVGFRPFVFRLAHEHALSGTVCNTSGCVEIEAEGAAGDLDGFLADLRKLAPPAARIENIVVESIADASYKGFKIINSHSKAGEYQPISPDLATCSACRDEIFDPDNRRHRYPFTNCTNCGPRFTIIEGIPYDRPLTTMSEFEMCPECSSEYHDPADRRFHAQPNACPKCGPGLELVCSSGQPVAGDALDETAALLKKGKIVAIKGLGGFLLACDATRDDVVSVLRQRKHRPAKPLAIMLKNLEEAHKICEISPEEEKLLLSPASPIVLLRITDGCNLAKNLAPNLVYIGVMLPYTPLHHLLMETVDFPLVMTSGNISEEPIVKDNHEALQRLGNIADYLLLHNRDIHSRYDDSVTMYAAGAERVLRRARGYAPVPVSIGYNSAPVLGVGADMKSSFCLARGEQAFLSQYLGDLDNAETLEHFAQTLDIYRHLFSIEPELIACDMHPDYQSTRLARQIKSTIPGTRLLQVQHHHAHIASVMAENCEDGPVIGVAFDGSGYGTDGAIWGGEFMLTDYRQFKRMAHFQYMPLPGGDAATRKPYRVAAGYLYRLMGVEGCHEIPWLGRIIPPLEFEILSRQIDRQINTPLTSSCGRLFDAVASIIGIRNEILYQAQAAIELEMAATGIKPSPGSSYQFEIAHHNDVATIGLNSLFSAIIRDVNEQVPVGEIAARFHYSLAELVSEMCAIISRKTGVTRVALSGGVFQNRLLLELVLEKLNCMGLTAISHKTVPTNDSCIALGQAAVGHFKMFNQEFKKCV